MSPALASGALWLTLGGVLAALGVAAAAFGSHALASRLDARALELWELAGRYLLYGGFALLVTGLAQRLHDGSFAAAGWALLLGTVIFTGTLFALSLGSPRWLGAVTPIGGTLLIAGYLLFAWAAWRG